MQRRLVEELKDLEIAIQSIKDKYAVGDIALDYLIWFNEGHSIIRILHSLLSAPDKAFEVIFKDKEYNFIYPTTEDEYEAMNELRIDLIMAILKECVDQMYAGNDTWWMVTAFASGIDALDMRIEIIGKEEHLNQVDADGKKITALPLDLDNYQINLQRPEVEFEDDTTTEKVDSI